MFAVIDPLVLEGCQWHERHGEWPKQTRPLMHLGRLRDVAGALKSFNILKSSIGSNWSDQELFEIPGPFC